MKNYTKLSLLTLILAVVLFSACKKEYESIQSIDDATLSTYISKNNLSSVMLKDATGFYSQITAPGSGTIFKNSDSVLYNLTIKSLSTGEVYAQSPLNGNLGTYVGYSNVVLTVVNIPAVRTAILRLSPGGTARILLPSYLAFGKNGYSTIPSNENIDIVVTTYPYKKQAELDESRIQAYLAAKGLTSSAIRDSYTGIYYIVSTNGTGTTVIDKELSTVVVNYALRLLDGTAIDSNSDGTFSTTFAPSATVIEGWKQIIPKFTAGTKLRMFIPSAWAYGVLGQTTVPANAVLDFDINIVSVTN